MNPDKLITDLRAYAEFVREKYSDMYAGMAGVMELAADWMEEVVNDAANKAAKEAEKE